MSKLTQAQLEQRRNAAPAGGRALVEKYGTEHMAEIGRKGARVQHERYDMIPAGTSNFAYVDKETREVIAYQFPVPDDTQSLLSTAEVTQTEDQWIPF